MGGGGLAKEVMPYPVGGIPCAASVTKFQVKTNMEEMTKKMGEMMPEIIPTLEGTLPITMAIQFPRSDSKGINDVNMIVCYGNKAQADGSSDKAKAAWGKLGEDLAGPPERQVVEGVVFPVAKFLFDDPLTLIPVGMSFGTYPLKPSVTLDNVKAVLTSEGMAMLRNEFGLLWMWLGVRDESEGNSKTAIISAVYSCEEACAVVQPKIGKVLKKLGMVDLMDGSPYLRVQGPGFMIKK